MKSLYSIRIYKKKIENIYFKTNMDFELTANTTERIRKYNCDKN